MEVLFHLLVHSPTLIVLRCELYQIVAQNIITEVEVRLGKYLLLRVKNLVSDLLQKALIGNIAIEAYLTV